MDDEKDKNLINSETEDESDILLRKKSTYIGVTAGVLAVIATIVLTVVACVSSNYGRVESSPMKSLPNKTEAVDGGVLSGFSEAYDLFNAHEKGINVDVNTTEAPVITAEPNATETPYLPPTAEPTEVCTEAPTAVPTIEPTVEVTALPTAEVVDKDYKYYNFSLEESGITSVESDGYIKGLFSDNVTSSDLTVSEDLDFQNIRIQNPYNAEGFSLRDILSEPLKIARVCDSPRVMLFYSHTKESYCSSEAERIIADYNDIKTYEGKTNITSVGAIIEEAAEKSGANVINVTDVNDGTADPYAKSSALVAENVATHKTIQLALDLHVNALEYPTGKRYAPTATADGKDYAKILFVITQNDTTNPNWRENIKLAIVMMEKLQKKVPGICLGISLRNDAKYNSTSSELGFICEVGFEGNLVSQAENSAAVLGEVLGEIYG